MSIVSGSIARPVTVAMATFAIVLFGAISLDRRLFDGIFQP